MAELDSNSRSEVANFSVYILDIIPRSYKCKYELYVCSTWKSVQERYAEHCERGEKSARIFDSLAEPGAIRWDLMDGFPQFYSRAAAERAEGRVARWLVNKGFRVRCNMLKKE